MQVERLLVRSAGKSWDQEYCWIRVDHEREPQITYEVKDFWKRFGFDLDYNKPAFAVFRESDRSELAGVAVVGLASSNQPNRDGGIFNSVIYRGLPEAELRGLAKSVSSGWSEIEASVDKAVVFDSSSRAGFRIDIGKLGQLCIKADREDARPATVPQNRRMTGGELANWFATTDLGIEFEWVVCRRKGEDWEVRMPDRAGKQPLLYCCRRKGEDWEVRMLPVEQPTTEPPRDSTSAESTPKMQSKWAKARSALKQPFSRMVRLFSVVWHRVLRHRSRRQDLL